MSVNEYPDTEIIDDVRNIFPVLLDLINNHIRNPGGIAQKTMFESKVTALFIKLFVFTEPFWQEFSFKKDNISLRFNKRCFPRERQKTQSADVKSEITDPQADLSKKRFIEFLKQIRSKYGRSGFSIQLAEANHVDENVDPVYKELQIQRYNTFVRQDTIDRIFELCLEHRFYFIMLGLFCSLACSREFYHLVVNKKIMNYMFNPALYTHEVHGGTPGQVQYTNPFPMPIIQHCIFYAMHLLYKEECMIKGYSQYMHRHILDLDCCARLPRQSPDLSPDLSPYIPLTLSPYFLKSEDTPIDCYIIKQIRNFNGIEKYRGFYSSWSFWIRFDIFSGGIFRGLSIDKVTFGGSGIPACMIRNPLEALFFEPPEDMEWLSMIPESDPMYPDLQVRFNKLRAFWEASQINQYFDEYYPSKTVIRPEYLDEITTRNPDFGTFMELEDVLSDIDVQIDVSSDYDFDLITAEIYQTIKRNLLQQTGLLDLANHQLKLMKIQSEYAYKYYISGSLLKRSLEIFRFYGMSPIGGVSRYHFPCVRGLAIPDQDFSGILYGRILVNPSLATAAMTGLMIDYRWMTETQNAQNLILKYYTRGYTMLMNKTEQQLIKEYIFNHLDEWGMIWELFSPDRTISVNHPIFRPREYGTGIYKKIMQFDPKYIRNPVKYRYLVDIPGVVTSGIIASNNPGIKSGVDLSLRFNSGNIKPMAYWKLAGYMK